MAQISELSEIRLSKDGRRG